MSNVTSEVGSFQKEAGMHIFEHFLDVFGIHIFS